MASEHRRVNVIKSSIFQSISPARASEHRRGREPPFLYRKSTNPVGVTDCCAAPTIVGINVLPPMLCRPYGAYILGDTIFHGGYAPAYTLSPYGLIICRGQAHKEPVPEWLPPFREKLRVGSLIADLIRNLLQKIKIQRYRDTEII